MVQPEVSSFPPPRVLLFVPGDRAVDLLDRAMGSGCDAVIVDMEDAVSPVGRSAARDTVRAALAQRQGPVPVYLRVGVLPSGVPDDDLELVAAVRPDAVLLPKAHDAGQVARFAEALRKRGVRPAIVPIIESARGLVELDEIASVPEVWALALGGEDLAADLAIPDTGRSLALLVPRMLVVIAARANGRAVFDTVTTEIPAGSRVRRESLLARRLGFDGKLAVHPTQVAPILEAFTPTMAEVEQARATVAGFEEALRRGEGVTKVAGRMVDEPVAGRARRVIAMFERGRP